MSEPPADTQRAASARETRRKLLAAATSLFAEQGLTKPSLDAICERAGYTRGAFYVHFKTRDDLIVAVMESVMGGFIEGIIAAGEAGADLAMIVRTFTHAVQLGSFPIPGGVRVHHVLEACARSERLRLKYLELLAQARTRVADTVARGQATGAIRADVPPDFVAQLLLVAVMGVEVAEELRVPHDATAVGELVLSLLKPPS